MQAANAIVATVLVDLVAAVLAGCGIAGVIVVTYRMIRRGARRR